MSEETIAEEHACAVCYGVLCHPSRISGECEHKFCRLCVYQVVRGSRGWASAAAPKGCPMCRMPPLDAVADALLPGDIEYDADAAMTLSCAYPSAYKAGLAKEARVEQSLRETLIPSLPLVQLPGSCVAAGGLPLRPNLGSKAITLYFSDKAAQKTLMKAQQQQQQQQQPHEVGVLFNEPSVHDGGLRGFLAWPVKGRFVNQSGKPYRARLAIRGEFELVGRLQRSDDEIYGAVEKLPMAHAGASPGRVQWPLRR